MKNLAAKNLSSPRYRPRRVRPKKGKGARNERKPVDTRPDSD